MRRMFTIDGVLPNLNDYLQAERVGFKRNGKFNTKGNIMKQDNQKHIISCIRRDLKGLSIDYPVKLHYTFYEPNRKRDLDNIASTCMKWTQDSLVKAGTLKNDGWNEITGFSCEFFVDKAMPRIEVVLEWDEPDDPLSYTE